MLSQRWKSPRAARRRTSYGTAVAALLVVALASGCATAPVSSPVPQQRVSADEWRFVLSPLQGYPLSLAPGVESELASAAAGLAEPTSWPQVSESAQTLLADNAGLHPATLLLGQVALLQKDYRGAVDFLRPIVDELPTYDAAQIALGRAAEKLGDLPLAYASFLASSERLNLASARAAQLRERATEIVFNRVGEALDRGRLEEAQGNLDLLEAWAPGELKTVRAARGVAVAAGNLEGELSAVTALSALEPQDRSLVERRAELELQVGDSTTGLRLLQDLSARYPDDAELADKLAEAKFVWRLVMLPDEAKELVKRTELRRGEFASVLYWLFPEVRYSRPSSGLIVNDIFDHPAREQIVRVVNLGLMSVDLALHHFEPERSVTRLEALTSYLALMSRSRVAPACLGSWDAELGGSVEAVCEAAARCGLVEAPACLPLGPLSGPTSAQMSRKVLEQLGAE